MSDELEPIVSTISQFTRLSARGDAIPMIRVDYYLGEHGPFHLELKKAEFTAGNVRSMLQAEASELRQLLS